MCWEHDYNPSTKEAESERSQSKDSIDSIRPCLKKTDNGICNEIISHILKRLEIYVT